MSSTSPFYPSTALGSPSEAEISAFYAAQDAEQGRIYGGLTAAEADEAYQAWVEAQPTCMLCAQKVLKAEDVMQMRDGSTAPWHKGDCYERLWEMAH